MNKSGLYFQLLTYLVFASSSHAQNGSAAVNGSAAGTCEAVPGEYLIRIAQTQEVKRLGDRERTARYKKILDDIGLREIKHDFKNLVPGLLHVSGGPRTRSLESRRIEERKRAGDIEYIEPNCIHHLRDPLTPNDPLYGVQYSLNNSGQTGGTPDVDIDAPEAWQLSIGSEQVVVAIIDSGINYLHPDLFPNLWTNNVEFYGIGGIDDDSNGYVDDIVGYNWALGDINNWDSDGHGSVVSGIIGAKGNNGMGIAGVSWSPKLMSLRTSSNGITYLGNLLAALEYVMVMKAKGVNVRVINYSAGANNNCSESVRLSLAQLNNLGILFVTAAGNEGYNNDIIPNTSNCPGENVISVAALDRGGFLTSWSNYGRSTVHIAAPGEGLISTDKASCSNSCRYSFDGVCDDGGSGASYSVCDFGTDCYDCGERYDVYDIIQGTSFSAPMVAGVASLIFSRFPQLTPIEARMLILVTAKRYQHLEGALVVPGVPSAYRALTADPNDVDLDGIARSSDCAPADYRYWQNKAYPDNDGDGVRNSSSLQSVSCFGNSVPNGYTLAHDGVDNCPNTKNKDQKDSDGDGIGDACDLTPNGNGNVNSADRDGDGVSNEQEASDGTDPDDPGSLTPSLKSPVFSLWNGFLDMTCILELVNNGSSAMNVTVSLFRIDGSLGSSIGVPLAPRQEYDVILNDMVGFERDSYGLVKIDYQGKLDGRVFYYRRSALADGFDFAFGVPLSNPSYGQTSVGFNTYQPSLSAAEAQNVVANWLSVVNLSAQPKAFKIYKYNQLGELLSSSDTLVPGFARIDVDGGHINPGANHVGLNVIIPADKTSPYVAQLMRYGYGSPAEGGFKFAFPLVAKAGNGRQQHVPISSDFAAQNWLEIVNASSKTAGAKVFFYDEQGGLLNSVNLSLAPFSQQHLNASAFLKAEQSGLATIIPEQKNCVVAQSMYYFRKAADGGMAAMYGSQAREALGKSLYGTYNLFLGMKNTLRLTNPTSQAISLKMIVHHLNPPTEFQLSVPANGCLNVPLHETSVYSTEADTYGVVEIEGSGSGHVMAEMLRTRLLPEGVVDFRAPTEVR